MKLNITLSKTRDGKQDYLQVMSDDFMAVNIVLIADSIEVQDARLVQAQPRLAIQTVDADAEDRSVRGRSRSGRK